MKTLLTLFVLLFSSSVIAELPISLFGVEILEKGEGYLENPDLHKMGSNLKRKICNVRGKTNPKFNNITFKKDNLFAMKCIKINSDKNIFKINTNTYWEYYDDFNNSDLNMHGLEDSLKIFDDIINNISSVFDIRKNKLNIRYLGNFNSDGAVIMVSFHINYQDKTKGNLLLKGRTSHIKSSNPTTNAGKIGQGSFSLELNSNQKEIDKYLETWKETGNLKKIRKKDLDEYINLFHSSASVF